MQDGQNKCNKTVQKLELIKVLNAKKTPFTAFMQTYAVSPKFLPFH